jgi:hypothetical protein
MMIDYSEEIKAIRLIFSRKVKEPKFSTILAEFESEGREREVNHLTGKLLVMSPFIESTAFFVKSGKSRAGRTAEKFVSFLEKAENEDRNVKILDERTTKTKQTRIIELKKKFLAVIDRKFSFGSDSDYEEVVIYLFTPVEESVSFSKKKNSKILNQVFDEGSTIKASKLDLQKVLSKDGISKEHQKILINGFEKASGSIRDNLKISKVIIPNRDPRKISAIRKLWDKLSFKLTVSPEYSINLGPLSIGVSTGGKLLWGRQDRFGIELGSAYKKDYRSDMDSVKRRVFRSDNPSRRDVEALVKDKKVGRNPEDLMRELNAKGSEGKASGYRSKEPSVGRVMDERSRLRSRDAENLFEPKGT